MYSMIGFGFGLGTYIYSYKEDEIGKSIQIAILWPIIFGVAFVDTAERINTIFNILKDNKDD